MPQTLLLADDSVTIQRVIELTFAEENITVVAVSDGDQAVASIEASPPDIVLADIGMPGRTGYEVAQYIKASPRLAHIPVLLLTGAFEPVDQAKAAEAGCDGVLAKPFEPQLVIQRVKELLSRPSGQTPGPTPGLASLDSSLAPPVSPEPGLWAPPLADRTPAPAKAASTSDVDSYFDRLDAAFANLSGAATIAPTAARTMPPIDDPAPIDQMQHTGADESDDAIDIDWFGQKPVVESPSAPVIDFNFAPEPVPVEQVPLQPPAPPVVEPPAPEPVVAPVEPAVAPVERAAPVEPVAATAEPVAPPPFQTLPPLADAFAALLTAEQRVGTPAWPSGPSPDAPASHPPAAPVDLDALAADVTRRVLDELSDRSDRLVRDTVEDIVSRVAERLVREEIERIKDSIK